MCFSLTASNIMLGLGIISSIWAFTKINWKVGILLTYFSIMQLIHVVGYLNINKCSNNLNQLASKFNYIHICFQPFIQILGYYGLMEYTNNIDKDSKTRIYYAGYLSLAIGIFLLARMFNLHKKLSTKRSETCIWCGETCSFKGEKHINFSLPLLETDYLIPSLFLHSFGMFIIPLFINKFIAILTIILALLTYIPAKIHNIETSEAGTIWCFTSITQILILIFVSFYYKK